MAGEPLILNNREILGSAIGLDVDILRYLSRLEYLVAGPCI